MQFILHLEYDYFNQITEKKRSLYCKPIFSAVCSLFTPKILRVSKSKLVQSLVNQMAQEHNPGSIAGKIESP